MGKKSGPSAPPPPDPAATARAQATANKEAVRESAKVNAVDIYSPYGQTTYEKDEDGVPLAQYTQLSDSGQQQLDLQNQAAVGLGQIANTKIGQIPTEQFDTSGLPYDPTGYGDPLINQWQGAENLPYDPSSQAYQGQAAALGMSGVRAQRDAMEAGQRADQLYGQAGAPNAVAGELARETAPGAQPYDPRTGYSQGVDAYRDDVSQAFFDRQASLLDPMRTQQRDRLEQDLADRGIPVGSEAYNDAFSNFNRGQADQYQRIANDAVLAGGQEAQRQLGMEQGINSAAFGQTLAGNEAILGALGQGFNQQQSANASAFGIDATRDQMLRDSIANKTSFEQSLRGTARGEAVQDNQLANSDKLARVQGEQNLRGTALQEQLLNRTQAFNEASALIQGSPALGVPQAPGVPQYNIAPPDIQGLTMANYNAQVNAYNAQAQRQSNMMSGAFGVLGAGISAFSRSELKEDIGEPTRIIDLARALPVKTWRYKPGLDAGNLHLGPMAEDFQKITRLGDGVTINLLDFCGFLLAAVQDLDKDVRALTRRSEQKISPFAV